MTDCFTHNCTYCGDIATKATGADIYPGRPDLADRVYWLCHRCDAWVGCHKGTETPLGTFANEELRQWRRLAHSVFDPLWKDKTMGRREAYSWLAEKLNISVEETHIGSFDLDKCRAVVRICSERRNGDRHS